MPWAPYVELKLSVDTGYKVDVGFEAVLGGRCTAEREVKLAELPKRVAKLLKIGKVKVEVQLSALVEADVEIKGGAIVGFTQEVDAVASAVIRNTTVKKAENRSLPPRTTPVREPQVSAPVSGGVKAGLRFAYSVGDSLGVVGLGWAYDLTHGVRFVADTEGSAYVDQELGYAIRARIRLLGKTYNPKVMGVSVKFRVWTGGTTRPPVPSGTAYVLANFAQYAKTNDGPARVVNPSVRGDVVLSPDGKRLAWADLSDLSKPTVPVMVSDLDGRNARRVAEEPNLGGLCSTPAWAPDSRRLLYPGRAETADQPDLWATVDVASGERKQLSPGTGCHPV